MRTRSAATLPHDTPPPKRRWRIERVVATLLCISAITTLLGLALTATRAFTLEEEERPWTRVSGALRRLGLNETDVANPSCTDNDASCSGWASSGECKHNPHFMNVSCRMSCGLCAASARQRKAKLKSCNDQSSFCGQWAAVGECDSNPLYMRSQCPVTCHLCQSTRCHDVDEAGCADQAKRGLCLREPERMYDECRWACKWCAMEKGTRCRRAANLQPAARRGALEHMFRRATAPEHATSGKRCAMLVELE